MQFLPVFALCGNTGFLSDLFQLPLFLGINAIWCLINILEIIDINGSILTYSFGCSISCLIWKKSSTGCQSNDSKENNGLKMSNTKYKHQLNEFFYRIQNWLFRWIREMHESFEAKILRLCTHLHVETYYIIIFTQHFNPFPSVSFICTPLWVQITFYFNTQEYHLCLL